MERSDKLEERIKNRRARRWKRRGRIAAPFLALPLLLATLLLSVDFIEYKPMEPPKKLVDRPLPKKATIRPEIGLSAKAALATSALSKDDELTRPLHEGTIQRAIDSTPPLPKLETLHPPLPPSSLSR